MSKAELVVIQKQIKAARADLDRLAQRGLQGTVAWAETMARYNHAVASQVR